MASVDASWDSVARKRLRSTVPRVSITSIRSRSGSCANVSRPRSVRSKDTLRRSRSERVPVTSPMRSSDFMVCDAVPRVVAWKLAKPEGVRVLPLARAKKRRQVH